MGINPTLLRLLYMSGIDFEKRMTQPSNTNSYIFMCIKRLIRVWVLVGVIVNAAQLPTLAQSTSTLTPLIPTPRQVFTPTTGKGSWNIDIVGDFYLPKTKSVTWSGAGRNQHVAQDWSKLFRRGFSSIERGRMTSEEIQIVKAPKAPGWKSRLSVDQRAYILYQNYFIDFPFNLPWGRNSELASQTYFLRPEGSNSRESLGQAMFELGGGCLTFGDCPENGRYSTYGKIFFDIENDGTSFDNRQEQANLYAYKMWALRQVISPQTEIGGIMPTPYNSFGYSRSSDFANTSVEWLWNTPAQHIDATNTRGRRMPDDIVGKSYSDYAHFQMPGTYFLISDFDYAISHNADDDRHWLASLVGEQEVNSKLSPKKRIAWQWLFNTQSADIPHGGKATVPAPPAIAEGTAIFYWFTGADGTIFWDDHGDLFANQPTPSDPGQQGIGNDRNYSCYEHYLHGSWRLFKHHGDMFDGQEKYLNENTECSFDNGKAWYKLNANQLKTSGLPFVRAIINRDQILIAATQPYAAPSKTSRVLVRYNQDGYRFTTAVDLQGDAIFLGRARMPRVYALAVGCGPKCR